MDKIRFKLIHLFRDVPFLTGDIKERLQKVVEVSVHDFDFSNLIFRYFREEIQNNKYMDSIYKQECSIGIHEAHCPTCGCRFDSSRVQELGPSLRKLCPACMLMIAYRLGKEIIVKDGVITVWSQDNRFLCTWEEEFIWCRNNKQHL